MRLHDMRQRVASALRYVGIGATRAVTKVERALCRLSGIVAGCGCVDDDPECCTQFPHECFCQCHKTRKVAP